MEDLDKAFDKFLIRMSKKPFSEENYVKEVKSFIRQREKKLLEDQCSHYKLKRTTGDMCLKCNVLFQPFGGVEQPKDRRPKGTI